MFDCNDMLRKSQRDNDKLRARVAELEKAISNHNADMRTMCSEGKNCGYQQYYPHRKCPGCREEYMIDSQAIDNARGEER